VENHCLTPGSLGARAADVFVGNGHGDQLAPRKIEGGAAEALADTSADLDLLVVGSRGYGPLRAVLLGSVSTALVRSAQSPLVVVPRGAA
jgi:nucleotide-binding universal stress UspA family protein